MSDWKVLVPAESDVINLVQNPSLEVDNTGYNDEGVPASSGRSSTAAAFGVWSWSVTPNSADDGVYYDVTVSASTDYYAIVHVMAPVSVQGVTCDLEIERNDTSATLESETFQIRDGVASGFTVFDYEQPFTRLSLAFTTPAGVTSIRIKVLNFLVSGGSVASGIPIFIDGICVCEEDVIYIDGDQTGCRWLGTAHQSRSAIGGLSRSNGIEKDFDDDYHFKVSEMIGIGATPTISIDDYTTQSGGQLNNIKERPFVFSLVGILKDADDDCNMNTERRELYKVLSHDSYPPGQNGWQPLTIRYEGIEPNKQISCHFEGGLEGNLRSELPAEERLALRFVAPEPKWYEYTERGDELHGGDSDTFRYFAARRKSTGQWDNTGLSVAGGGTVYAVEVSQKNGLCYIGFDGTNWDNSGIDYIAVYDDENDSWDDVGSASFAFNGAVYGIDFDASGNLYAVGVFTDGAGNRDYIAKFDGTNWTALGNPSAGATITSIYTILVASNGDIWVGGDFTNFAGIANADYVAYYDVSASAWSAASTGLNNAVQINGLAEDSEGNIWAGGDFTQDGSGNTVRRLTYFDGTDWDNEVGGGINNTVIALYIDDKDNVYVGGEFTGTADAAYTIEGIAMWNGQTWDDMNEGVDVTAGTSGIYDIAESPDGLVWIVGNYTTVKSLESNFDPVARWNGYTWLYTDIEDISPFSIAFSKPNATIKENYSVFVGSGDTGTYYFNGTLTHENPGNATSYPKIVIRRTDALGSEVIFKQIRNETSGTELRFDYGLVAGEEIIIDTNPQERSIVSNIAGRIPQMLLPGTNMSDFKIYPDSNQITAFYQYGAGVTIEITFYYTPAYRSLD